MLKTTLPGRDAPLLPIDVKSSAASKPIEFDPVEKELAEPLFSSMSEEFSENSAVKDLCPIFVDANNGKALIGSGLLDNCAREHPKHDGTTTADTGMKKSRPRSVRSTKISSSSPPADSGLNVE